MNEQVQHAAEDSPPEKSAPDPTLGELMIAARERWNLSAGDVARQLRLALRQVQALEDNRFEALPGNTFVRGFIRNYAKVVQTDPATFLDAYERNRPQLQTPEIWPIKNERIDFTAKPIPKWVWYLASAAVLAMLIPIGIYLALQDDELPAKPTPQAVQPTPSNVTAEEAQMPLNLPLPQVVSSDEARTSTPSDTAPNATPAPNPPAAIQSAGGAAPTSPHPILQLNFEGNAWVEIRDKSGKKIFSQLSRSGSEQVVQGEPPLSLVVGDAAKVKITYNGNPVDLAPHIRKTVARLTLE